MDIISTIVMTTYNGEKYLMPQLDSIRDQTMPVDEVIIMDDCSSDGTVKLIENYIKDNDLKNWKLHINETNQGWKKNFKLGFDIARGKYIFSCDQDDIWHLDKCQRMIQILDSNPGIDLLVSNYSIFFSEKDVGSGSYQHAGKKMQNDGSIKMLSLDPKWPYINRPGCTFCFRKDFFLEIKEKWDTYFPHDAVLWRFARIKGTMAILNESLIDFRRHGDNATSITNSTIKERIKGFNDYIYFHELALKCIYNEKDKNVITNGLKFLKKRKEMFETRNLIIMFELIIKYRNFYLSYRGIVGDIIILLRNK